MFFGGDVQFWGSGGFPFMVGRVSASRRVHFHLLFTCTSTFIKSTESTPITQVLS